MTSRDFCYWIQGYFEISGEDCSLAPEQIKIIKKHLNMVFLHEIDPSYGGLEEQVKLNEIHDEVKKTNFPSFNVIPNDTKIRC